MCNKMLRKSMMAVAFAVMGSLFLGETGMAFAAVSEGTEIEGESVLESGYVPEGELGLEELEEAENVKSMVENKAEKTEEDSQDKQKDLKERIVTVKGSKFVTDTFNGVKALYRAGGNDGTNATYSCAAYVKRYYSEVYDVTVCNLFAGCTPVSSKGNFRKVSSPKEGDIVATSSGSGNHWAIVKNVGDNGIITLIEQNWKWQQDGKTAAKVNRKVKAGDCKIYRLKK